MNLWQVIGITCTQLFCDVTLLDQAFTQACEDIRGAFWNGVAFAKNVDRTSLSSFDVELYCIKDPQFEIDPTANPDKTIPYRFELLQDFNVEIIRNVDTGTDLYKSSNDLAFGEVTVDTSFSVYEDYSGKFSGIDDEDSSIQGAIMIHALEYYPLQIVLEYCCSLYQSSYNQLQEGKV